MKQTSKQFFSTQEGKLTLALAAMVLCWTFFIVYISKTDVGDRWFPTQKKINLVKREIQNMTASPNAANPSPLQKVRTQKAEIDKLKAQDIAAKATYWNADRDGQPETELRNLVSAAAQRVEANLQNLGSVRMSTINSELSYADLEFTVVDEYDKIIRLIAEIEKCKPRLSWRSADIRVENSRARTVTAANRQNGATTTTTTPNQMFRTTMRVRVIKYSPAGNTAGAKTATTAKTATAAKTGTTASAPASASSSAPASTQTTKTSAATSSPAEHPEQAQPAQPASADTPAQKESDATATNNKENEE
ncbi:MAG: hypothetical protein J6Y80_04055 [Victivallales bacterium]|nr:hypothetical protein [Victivallales bacterium]